VPNPSSEYYLGERAVEMLSVAMKAMGMSDERWGWSKEDWIRKAVRILTPIYPNIPLSYAIRLCRDETPQQITGGQLTRREAHEWLLDGGPSNVIAWRCSWLARRIHREQERRQT